MWPESANAVASTSLLPQILVKRFAADAKLARQMRLRLTAGNAPAQLRGSFRQQRLLATAVSAALLGEGDPFALPLADQRPLELGERAHHRQHQIRHWRVFTGEGQVLLDEFDAHAALGQALHDATQVIEIARQPIHALHDDGIAVAHEVEQCVELRTLRVLARRLVGEEPIDGNLIELAISILVEAADPDVADALTVQMWLPQAKCQSEL